MFGRLLALYKLTEEAYFKPSKHVFVTGFHVVLVACLYEVLIRIFKTPEVIRYNATDIWFYVAWRYIPAGTLVFSLGLIAFYGRDMYRELKGIKTPAEEAKDKDHEKKVKDRFAGFLFELRRAKKEEKGKIPIHTVPFTVVLPEKKSYKPNWGLTLLVVAEGFIRGALMLMVVGFLTKKIVHGIAGTEFYVVPVPLDSLVSLTAFATNTGQDLAIAFGSALYEEWLFRVIIFSFLASRVRKVVELSLPIPFTKKKIDVDNGVITVLCAIVYALSAHVFGDNYHFYPFVYRVILGIALTRIYQRRGLAVGIWSHIVHDLWYFFVVR